MNRPRRKIAFFMHDLSGGGVERMRLRLATGLVDRGYDVQLIVQCARGPLARLVPADITLTALGAPHSWGAMWALAGTLRSSRPDILVSSLDHNNIVALCARVLAGGRTKIIICQHNTLSGEAVVGWRYRVVPLLYRVMAWRADAIIAVSDGVAADLVRTACLPAQRINVVYNPVVTVGERTYSAPPHPWLETRAVPTFVFAGRLVAQKDPLLLLESFALRLHHGPARLIICGDGPLLTQLRERANVLAIAHAVFFAGFVEDPLPWMAAASALVVTSKYEGFANVIVEAMSCGTPVIATDCTFGPSEILGNGRFGRLAQVGDAGSVARCMQEELRAIFPAETLARRAQAFSVGACVARHEKLFDQLLASRRTKVFGLELTSIDAAGISRLVLEQRPEMVQLVVTPNIDHLRLLREPRFGAAYQFATLVCPDGFPVALYAWLRGAGSRRRVTGCEIFQEIAKRTHSATKRVVVVAESVETAQAVANWAARRQIDAVWKAVVAAECLCDDLSAQQSLVAAINAHAPDLLIVTLGAPASEVFVYLNRNTLGPCWALCVGQAVRVELGLARRAPAVLQRCHMEWAWRLAREPRRLVKRYVLSALMFPMAIVADLRRS
jgi:exopolysaccharide biosynthesis WecB/TagA/CpsF family protein